MWTSEEKDFLCSLSLKKLEGNEGMEVTEGELKKLNAVDREGNTLLHKAAICGDNEATELLLYYGVNVNYVNPLTRQKAIDIVWENGHYECMLLLLQGGSTFPQDFSSEAFYEDSEIPEKLKTFVKESGKLHE